MMDDHRKRIVALEGTFVLDSTGHYIPEAEREEPLKYRGIIILAGAILLWAIFFADDIENQIRALAAKLATAKGNSERAA